MQYDWNLVMILWGSEMKRNKHTVEFVVKHCEVICTYLSQYNAMLVLLNDGLAKHLHQPKT